MSGFGTVAVAGLGLIGGSVARDLAAAGVRVLGWDRAAAAVDAALREGVVSAALGPGFEGVEEADVLVLAVPVGVAAAVLEAAAPRLGGARLVTDTGSTKASIVAAAERLGIDRFVGAHPFAGDHRSGWEASRTGLFQGATVYLCPTARSSGAALSLARELWSALGGIPAELPAAEHDRRLAWTSHLPQVVSAALAATVAAEGFGRADLGRGGRDVTRLAASSASLWADILADNRAAVAGALAAMEARLRRIREAVEAGETGAIRASAFPPAAWLGEP
ncbi:MAG: prephenate dehydrogenase [Longimicrobiaceae bacterium]